MKESSDLILYRFYIYSKEKNLDRSQMHKKKKNRFQNHQTSKKFKLSIDLFYDGVNGLNRYQMKKQNDSMYFLNKKQNMTIDFQNLPYSQRENKFPKVSISAKKVSIFVCLLKKQNFSEDSKIFHM